LRLATDVDRGVIERSLDSKYNAVMLKGKLNSKILLFFPAARFRWSGASSNILDTTSQRARAVNREPDRLNDRCLS
jgi:hypothetical protein